MSTNSKNKNLSGRSLLVLATRLGEGRGRSGKHQAVARTEHEWLGFVVNILCCLLLAYPAGASTTWLQRQKLLASDGAAGDYFGRSVSISGDYAIVGASYDDDKGYNSGSAYIFRWDGTAWSQQQKLLASDGDVNDYFGWWSVSISGDYAIVGAYLDDDKGYNSGSAYIFRRDGTAWVQQQKLTASDGAALDEFGWSVSISGDLAIVGAIYGDGNEPNSGSAYIFKWDGTSWNQQAKLLASDGDAGDRFGFSLSISSDYAIVGACEDDDKGTESGSAYIFKRHGTAWSQLAKLTASDGASWDYFGWSVSISGDLAIVGAPKDDDKGSRSGSAYIFKRDVIDWVQQQKLLASDGAYFDYFGVSVSISGDLAIVGACYDDDNGSDSGSAYIFKWHNTTWVELQKILASDGAAEDWFGRSVSISGEYVIVGASCDDDKGTNSGSAYIFIPCADWLTADLSGDCFVDFEDFGIFANQWLKCGDPCDPNCQP